MKIFYIDWIKKYRPHKLDMMKPEKGYSVNNVKGGMLLLMNHWNQTKGQFENVDNMHTQNPPVHDYSFNLTGIVPPQPPKWKQVDHLYEDFKKFRRPVPMFLMDLWLMYQTK